MNMKVSDIRPDDVMAGQRAAMQADVDWLAARKASFVPVACPACGSDDAAALYEKHAMQQRRCCRCETQYVSPRPPAEMLGAFYAQSENYRYWAKYIFPKSVEARRGQLFRPRAQMVGKLLSAREAAGGTLVEVGAAHGLFCDEARKLGLFSRIVAIEPTPDLADACRKLGLETIEAPYEDVALNEGADVVACFEVLEHLFDPAAFLKWAHRILRPDGILFLTCPNSAGFETLVLKEKSDTVDHEHLNLFTPQSLKMLAEACGYADVSVTTPGRLDVEIVQQKIAGGELPREALDPVLQRLLACSDPRIAAAMQDLLANAGLSSHMCLTAQRPAAS